MIDLKLFDNRNTFVTCFNLLIGIINEMSSYKNYISRKATINFRDNCLLDIYKFTLQIFNSQYINYLNNPQDDYILSLILKLLYSCINYNFIGTYSDETSEDITNIHLPSSWHCVFDNFDIIKVLSNIYLAQNTTSNINKLILD